MLWLFCAAVGGCGGSDRLGPPMLGENFPPYAIEFEHYEAPEFPAQLRATGIANGYVVIAATVGMDGHVEDAIALEASHLAFARALLEVASAWQFTPVQSETLPRREVLHYVFRRTGVATGLSHLEGAKAAFAESNDRPMIRTVTLEELEEAPRRVSGGPPVAIDAALAPGESGVATVSFVIDELGSVRIPTLTAATDPALGEAALAAVAAWRFAPSYADGTPVLVEVLHSFTFEGKAADTR